MSRYDWQLLLHVYRFMQTTRRKAIRVLFSGGLFLAIQIALLLFSRPLEAQLVAEADALYRPDSHDIDQRQIQRIDDSKTSITTLESNDFATRILHDPWDMSEYDDISQYLNESGQRQYIRNVAVTNGIFSANSVPNGPISDGIFWVLFPGYLETMKIGKIGYRYPINSSEYRCLYVAMQVDSGPAVAGVGPDVLQVFWFADPTLNSGSSPWGMGGQALYPEAGAAQPAHYWKLHQMVLNAPQFTVEDGWDSSPQWQGLRLDVTAQGNVNFAVDWVRLTDCQPNLESVSFRPEPEISSIWIKPNVGSSYIRVADDVNGTSGSYRLDTQGIQAGMYTIGVGTQTLCCIDSNVGKLTINNAPTLRFIKPSYTSGQDFATTAGNTWDFADNNDITRLENGSGNITNGLLNLVTESGPFPAGTDVQIDLNTPDAAPVNIYRYLTIRMKTEWNSPWQDVVSGMIGRWIWTTTHFSGGTRECIMVSQDIAHNVSWQTYSIDLYDYFNGAMEESFPRGGPCPLINHSDPQVPPQDISANPAHWLNSGSVIRFRYDPNENISCDYADETNRPFIPCSDYRQEIDWIALTAMDSVQSGDVYVVEMDVNKALMDDSFIFYYTSTPSQPQQNRAVRYVAPTTSPTTTLPSRDASDYIYLPLLASTPPQISNGSNLFERAVGNAATFMWDTSGVSTGQYYICAVVSDGINSTSRCSDVPLVVE